MLRKYPRLRLLTLLLLLALPFVIVPGCGGGGGGANEQFALSLSGSHGQVRVNGTLHSLPWSGEFDEDTTVDLEAVPDSGYGFTDWSGDLSGSTNPTSVSMTSDKSVTANFSNGAPPQHTLSISGNNGRVRVDGTLHALPWSGQFNEGANVDLEAVPDSGYGFTDWSGDLSGSTNPTSVSMTSDKSVTANFSNGAPPQHTLSISGNNGRVRVDGTLHALPWSGQFNEGANVDLEAVPDSGYQFSHWSGDLSGSTNPTSITMTANKTVTATFEPIPRTLHLSGSHGRVRVNGILRSLPWSGQFNHGTNVTLEALPDTCYEFSHWLWDLSGSTNPTSITMTSNKTIAANFSCIQYALNLSGTHGRVRVNGTLHGLPWSVQFDCGATVDLEAVPDSGYRFTDWSGDLTGSANPTTITMTSDKNVTANFWPEDIPFFFRPDQFNGKDTYVDSAYPDDNYYSENYMMSGVWNTTDCLSLVQFNEVAGIPSNATIVSATLSLYCFNYLDTAEFFDVHRIMQSWNSTTVTWNNCPAWDPYSYDQVAISGSGWKNWHVTDLVQDWIDGTRSNHGFLIKMQGSLGQNYRARPSFRSSEYGTESLRPKLTGTYRAP